MKKIGIISCILGMLLLASCAFPVRYSEVRGSGQPETETRHISGIESVDLNGIGTLMIEQGDRESLEITADKNLLEYIESDVSGKVLTLGVRGFINIQPTSDVIYHLTVKDLSRLETSGLGNIEVKALDTDKLWLEISGGGSINIADLQADELDLEISGMGSVDLSGRVNSQDVEISGTGSYQAGDLFSRQADVQISGTGNAVIWAADSLNLESSGMGNLDYYGEPILNMDLSGTGKVKALGSK